MKVNLKTMLLLVGVLLIASVPCAFAHTDVTAEQAKELIDTTEDMIVVDVREPHEYTSTRGHIPGALNYPWNSGVLQAKYEELPVDGPVLVVCASGGRSNRAANFLDSNGFSMVYDMLGGMSAWKWETVSGDEAEDKYGGGTGEPNDPYQIATAEDLLLLGETPEDYDKHFILTADIELDPNLPSGQTFSRAPVLFLHGTFDGNGHVICNLHISGNNELGLFGELKRGALIKNLGVLSINVEGTGDQVGGLVGSNEGSVIRCWSTGTVSGKENVGGLVGYNYSEVIDCKSACDVNGIMAVGGLLGDNDGEDVRYCCASGQVTGIEYVGGFLGYNSGLIENSYSSMGIIIGYDYVAGFAGANDGNIVNCYSTCKVVPGHYVAGFVETNWAVVSDCFWDMETSGQTQSAGGIGKTTAEMQTASTFLDAGWDFVGEIDNGTEDIWSICEGTNYPRFIWQIPAGDFVCPDGITRDDFFFLLEFWLNDNCDVSNDFCQGTDLDQSGTVDGDDLEIFFEIWRAEE